MRNATSAHRNREKLAAKLSPLRCNHFSPATGRSTRYAQDKPQPPGRCDRLRELRRRIAISLVADIEHDAKPCFAPHHAFVGLSGSFQWKDFVHRLHSVRRAKL